MVDPCPPQLDTKDFAAWEERIELRRMWMLRQLALGRTKYDLAPLMGLKPTDLVFPDNPLPERER